MLETKRAFVTLDGLRAIAALAVITRHAPAYFAPVSIYVHPANAAKPVAVGPFFESYLAVDFFFVLSGFVLAYAYAQRLREGLSAPRFIAIRLIRLYPLYLLALAVSALVMWRQAAHGEIDALRAVQMVLPALLFCPSPSLNGLDSLFPLNVPAWSLFFELFANACFGLVAARLTTKGLAVAVGLAGAVLGCSVAVGLFGFGSAELGAMADGFQWQSFGAGVLRVSYSFFAGVLVYQIWTLKKPAVAVPPYAVALVLIVLLTAHPARAYQPAFDLATTLIIFPILVWFGASAVVSGFAARVFVWSGAASYAAYVLQAPLYDLTHRLLGKFLPDNAGVTHFVFGPMFVAFVLAVAILADRYFDEPVRRILMFRLASPTPRRANSSA